MINIFRRYSLESDITSEIIIDTDILGVINTGGQKTFSFGVLENFLDHFNLNKIKINNVNLSSIDSIENWPKDVSFNTDKLSKL